MEQQDYKVFLTLVPLHTSDQFNSISQKSDPETLLEHLVICPLTGPQMLLWDTSLSRSKRILSNTSIMVTKFFKDEMCTFTIYYKILKNPQQTATKYSALEAAGLMQLKA